MRLRHVVGCLALAVAFGLVAKTAFAQSEYLEHGVGGVGVSFARVSTANDVHGTGTAIGASAEGWFDVGLKGVTLEGTPYPRGFYLTAYPIKQGWHGNSASVGFGLEYQLSNGESGIDVLTLQTILMRRYDLSSATFVVLGGSFGILGIVPGGVQHIGAEYNEWHAGFGGSGEIAYDLVDRIVIAAGMGVSKYAGFDATYSIGVSAVVKLKKHKDEGVPF